MAFLKCSFKNINLSTVRRLYYLVQRLWQEYLSVHNVFSEEVIKNNDKRWRVEDPLCNVGKNKQYLGDREKREDIGFLG